MFDDWFNDEDDDPEATTNGDWDVSVESNVDHLSDVDASVSVEHVYSRTRDGGSTGTTDPASGGGDVKPSAPTTPDRPTPKEDPESIDRGQFAFPQEKSFMQALEIRAKNGAHQRVETVYVVTGDSYTHPTDVFALDDPQFYSKSTPTSVRSYGKKMAERVANSYPAGEAPGLVARFHTHPGGRVSPSSTDQESADAIQRQFEEAFDTTDFEFFHGIHSYQETSVGPDDRHRAEQAGSNVKWYGEQYRHELGVFDAHFRTPREVVVE